MDSVEVNQIQTVYRAFQSWAQEDASKSDADKRTGKQKMFKDWLSNQEDPTGKAGETDGLFYPYDVKNIPHVGTGHKLTDQELKDPKWSKGITGQQKKDLFNKDVDTARTTAKGKYGKRFDDLKEREQIALTEYSFIGHSGKGTKTGKTELDAKIRKGSHSDKELEEEFAKTPDAQGRNEGRKKLYSDLVNFDMNNRSAAVKKMLDAHVAFMEKNAVKSLEKRHDIPMSYGEKIVDQQIEAAKKFDKKDVSIKDIEKFNRLIARQLGSLGLKD